MKKIASVRRTQLISTYGVGALVAAEDASYMVKGLNDWKIAPEPTLHEPRLEDKLGVEGFYEPPALGNGHDIPAVRFPMMYSCPDCKRLAKHGEFGDTHENECPKCRKGLVPSRFVVACKAGHVDDFPFMYWVHGASAGPGEHRLSMRALGKSGGLDDLEISCTCNRKPPRTLRGAFAKGALKGFECAGRRPWLSDSETRCVEEPRTLQRGASNLWFPNTDSSISIPPWSEAAFDLVNRYWSSLQHVPDFALQGTLEGMLAKNGMKVDVSELIALVALRKGGGEAIQGADLRQEEYDALLRGAEEKSRDDLFVCSSAEPPEEFAPWIDSVRRVERLREVRALVGFTRLYPQADEEQPTDVPLFAQDPKWRPAIEVRGEGVFFRFNEKSLHEWEDKKIVKQRLAKLRANYSSDMFRGNTDKSGITPRLLLIHTFAHMLLNQWALDSGYPASSLRERIYSSHTMAGFMIYTASSDSAGSLGGVVAQAQRERLSNSLRGTLRRGQWCSSDPLCIEADSQGTNNVNLAACHSCVLLPEVSCEQMNCFLDRGLVIGTPEEPTLGFFHRMEE